MNLIRLYMRVLKQLGPESRLGIVLALANVLLAIAQFAEPVLFGRIVDLLSKAQATGIPPKWADLCHFGLGLGRLRPVHDRRRGDRGAPRRPARASPAARDHGRLFRACPDPAALVSCDDPFGPRTEGDAGRSRRHAGAAALLLPGAFLLLRRARRALAADAVHQLAARRCCSSCCCSCSPSSPPWCCARRRRCRARSSCFTRASRPTPPTRSATSR